MMLRLSEEHENGLEYERREPDEIVGIWCIQPVFQVDPGASSSAERHHGLVCEYEEESC